MEMTTVTLTIEKSVKEKAENNFANLGMTLEEYFLNCLNATMSKAAADDDMAEAMAECEEMLRNPNDYKSYTDIDELFADLDRACEEDGEV